MHPILSQWKIKYGGNFNASISFARRLIRHENIWKSHNYHREHEQRSNTIIFKNER